MDDGEYYSSGDPPIAIAPPVGGSPDCEIGVAPPSAATDEIEPVAFKTAGCERNAGE